MIENHDIQYKTLIQLSNEKDAIASSSLMNPMIQSDNNNGMMTPMQTVANFNLQNL